MKPSILKSKVSHRRLGARRNAFCYGVYYLALPLHLLNHRCVRSVLSVNCFGATSFYEKDHGLRDGSDLRHWVMEMLDRYAIPRDNIQVTLICMPRILGYVFNPVSFFPCHDDEGRLRAALCEVNNTFGETHTYICAKKEGTPIEPGECLTAKKMFHVSPFMQRGGEYRFRFNVTDASMGVWIDYYEDGKHLKLTTSLCGNFIDLTNFNLWFCFCCFPAVTVKTIVLIHWQAFKLVFKGIRYIAKPVQRRFRISATEQCERVDGKRDEY